MRLRAARRSRLAPPVSALLIALSAGASFAQQTLPEVKVTDKPPAPDGLLPLDVPASTGSRLGLTPRETPASVNVIDRATIEARDARDTQEVVRGAPGVNAAAPPGFSGFVTMRGFSGAQVTQLWNGINTLYDVISARPVDSWLLDRVEVLGGPASFLYGAGAVGGAINYVTKIAQREPTTNELFASYGSFDTARLAYGFNGPLGGADARNWVRIDAAYQNSDGYVQRSDWNSTAVAASWLADLTPSLSHTLAFDYVDEKRLPYWGTPILNPVSAVTADPRTIRINYNVADGTYQNEVWWGRSILESRLAPETRLRNTLYWYDADRLYRNLEVYRWNATNSLIERGSLLAQRHKQELYGDRFEAIHEGVLVGLPSDWAGGFDIAYNEQTRFPFSFRNITASTGVPLDAVDPFNPDLKTFFSFGGIQDATVPDRTNKVRTLALFVENRTRLTPALSVLTGLRFDDINLRVFNHRAVTATAPLYFNRDFNAFTGRIGLMYEFGPTANVYATYSTAADPPAGVLATASFAQLRDFGLTRGWQVEVGSKFDFWERRGNATLAAYRIERENLAITDPANRLNVLPIGQQSSTGVEAAVGALLAPGWRVQANAAYVWPRFDEFFEASGTTTVSRAGNEPPNVPRLLANAWLTWNPFPDWEAGLAYRYVGRRYADNANTIRVSGYDLLDAYVSYRVLRGTWIALRVRNLTNETYVQFVDSSPMLIFGEPRSVELSVRAAF